MLAPACVTASGPSYSESRASPSPDMVTEADFNICTELITLKLSYLSAFRSCNNRLVGYLVCALFFAILWGVTANKMGRMEKWHGEWGCEILSKVGLQEKVTFKQ